MCLAIPAKILSVNGNVARIDAGGIIKDADIRMLNGLKKGDFVLVHAGFAIQKMSVDEAMETLAIIEEMGK